MMAMGRMMESRGTRSAAWLVISSLAVLGAGWFHARATALQMAGAYLERMEAPGARLTQVDFDRANLRWSNLTAACLDGCNLNQADLSQTNLAGASLRNATLISANLQAANMGSARLNGADLTDAHLEGTNLQFVDLRDVRLLGATYSRYTTLPEGCDPTALGMRFIDVE